MTIFPNRIVATKRKPDMRSDEKEKLYRKCGYEFLDCADADKYRTLLLIIFTRLFFLCTFDEVPRHTRNFSLDKNVSRKIKKKSSDTWPTLQQIGRARIKNERVLYINALYWCALHITRRVNKWTRERRIVYYSQPFLSFNLSHTETHFLRALTFRARSVRIDFIWNWPFFCVNFLFFFEGY